MCLVLFGPPSTPNSGGSHRIDAGSSSPARHTYRLSILLGKNQISAAYRYHSRGSLPSHANSAATSWPRCERLSNTERGRELGRYPVERLGLNQGAQNVADGIARTVLLTFGEPPCLCCQGGPSQATQGIPRRVQVRGKSVAAHQARMSRKSAQPAAIGAVSASFIQRGSSSSAGIGSLELWVPAICRLFPNEWHLWRDVAQMPRYRGRLRRPRGDCHVVVAWSDYKREVDDDLAARHVTVIKPAVWVVQEVAHVSMQAVPAVESF